MKIERNFGMTDEAWRAWLEKHGDDPQGCTVCGAIAGTCADFPLCPGNPLWKEGPVEMADDPAQFTKEKIEELEAVFDLRWKADMRAIKRWQEAHPGNDLVWPDHADLCVWLLEELDKRTAEHSQDEMRLRRMLAHAYAGEHLYGDDGELQDGRIPFPIDFVRDSVQQIERKIHDRGMYQLANATCPECGQIVPVFGHSNACSRVKTNDGMEAHETGADREREKIRDLLTDCRAALQNWVRTYAPEQCTDEAVQKARQQIADGGGTLAYAARLSARIRDTLGPWKTLDELGIEDGPTGETGQS